MSSPAELTDAKNVNQPDFTQSVSISVPNTAIKEKDVKVHYHHEGIIGEDINSNPTIINNSGYHHELSKSKSSIYRRSHIGECISSPTPVVAVKRTPNAIEIEIEQENNKKEDCSSSSYPKLVTIDPEENRVHRVDVLWSVGKGKLPEAGASISNCLIEPETRNNGRDKSPSKSRVWSGNGPNEDSKTDPNQNIVVTAKKSEDNQGDYLHRQGHDEDVIRRDSDEGVPKLRRRPLFNWPWHTNTYVMNVRFAEPEFRASFTSRILFMKALQWGIITAWTFTFYYVPFLKGLDPANIAWTIYLAVCILMATTMTIRSTNLIEKHASYAVIFIYTVCLSHLCALAYAHYNSAMIPIVLMTLASAYLLSGLTLHCMEIDSDTSDAFYPIFTYSMLNSLLAFWIVLGIRMDVLGNPLAKMVSIWLPSCMMSLILCSIEMVEIQAILRGRRLPLMEGMMGDWVLATSYLL